MKYLPLLNVFIYYITLQEFCLTVIVSLRNENSAPYVYANYSPEIEYCSTSTILEGSKNCRIGAVEDFNAKISPALNELLRTPFFRYYKINLHRKCLFWDYDPRCMLKECSIETLQEDPYNWESWLSDVRMPTFPINIPLQGAWEYDEDEFCLLDQNGATGSYVDLIENPERFTGYSGPEANNVWAAIYGENCFGRKLGINPLTNSAKSDWDQCTERKTFYRLLSGMHASISVHLSNEYFNTETEKWENNFDLFHEKVGKHKERLQNMYILFALISSAISDISELTKSIVFTQENSAEEEHIHELIQSIASNNPLLPDNFEEFVFSSDTTPQIIEEFKINFKRISRILDCVACERCRLWGKIQVTGIGTALKISFNLKKLFKNPESLFLRRSEIVALYNTYGRLSHSIIAVAKFRERFKSGLYSRKKTESSNRSFPNLMKNLSSARSRIFVFSMAFTILVIIAHLLICFFLRRKKPKAVNK